METQAFNTTALAMPPAGTDSNGALIQAAQQGDPQSFNELMAMYQERVTWHCRRRGLNEEEAADVTQEVFIKVHRWLGRYDHQNAFRTWLYRITETTCIDHIRARIRYQSRFQAMPTLPDGEEFPVPDNGMDPEQFLSADELGEEIATAIEILTPIQREAFVLREFEGLRYDEIGKRTGCSAATVKTRLYQARQKLMSQLRHCL